MRKLRSAVAAVILVSACGKGGDPPPATTGAAPPVPRAAPADPLRDLEVPTVRAGAGVEPVPHGVLVVASATAIVVDGTSIAPIAAGQVGPASLDPDRREITPLVAWAKAWVASRPAAAPVVVAVAPTLPAPVLMQIAASFAAAGVGELAVVVRTSDGLGVIVARAPTKGAAPSVAVAPDDARATADAVTALAAARRAPADVTLGWAAPPPPPPVKPASTWTDQVAMTEDEAARFADLLTASGDDDHDGDMVRRQPGTDLGAQLDQIAGGGAKVAVGGGTAQLNTGVGGGMAARVDVGGASSGTIAPGVNGPPGRVTLASARAVDDTLLAVDAVKMKVLSAYLAGIKRCYRNQLKIDPNLHGALGLRFTVNEAGRATRAQVDAPTPALGACVDGLVASWRFPVPHRPDDGEAVTAAFQLELALVPE